MSKIICGATIAVMCLLCVGCSLTTHFGGSEKAGKSGLASPSTTVHEKAKKAPEAENQFTIQLAENPTTGYSWQYEIADPSMIVLENDYYEADKVAPGITGSGGIRYLTFMCKKSGDSSIELVYRRAWKGGETAEKREVTVSYTMGDSISWDMQKVR